MVNLETWEAYRITPDHLSAVPTETLKEWHELIRARQLDLGMRQANLSQNTHLLILALAERYRREQAGR